RSGSRCRRVISRGKIGALPVVVLANRPYHLAVTRLDLLVVIEPPEDFAFEVTLDQLERFLSRRIRSGGRHNDAARKHPRWTSGGVIVAVPTFHNIAIHVDHDHGLCSEGR